MSMELVNFVINVIVTNSHSQSLTYCQALQQGFDFSSTVNFGQILKEHILMEGYVFKVENEFHNLILL